MRKIPAPLAPERWLADDDDSGHPSSRQVNFGNIQHVDDGHQYTPPVSPVASALAPSISMGQFLAPDNDSTSPSNNDDGFSPRSVMSPHLHARLSQDSSPPASGLQPPQAEVGATAAEEAQIKRALAFPVPPKTQSQLVKQSPKYIRPTGKDEMTSCTSNPLYYGGTWKPPQKEIMAQTKGKFIDQQRVRLSKKKKRTVNMDGSTSVTNESLFQPPPMNMSTLSPAGHHLKLPTIMGRSRSNNPNSMDPTSVTPRGRLGEVSPQWSSRTDRNDSEARSVNLQAVPSLPPLNFATVQQQESSVIDPLADYYRAPGQSALFAYGSLRAQAAQTARQPAGRADTPIETKVEMWKSGKNLYTAAGSWTARSLTRLTVPEPDQEVRQDLLSRKHKIPVHLLGDTPFDDELKTGKIGAGPQSGAGIRNLRGVR